MTTYKVDYVYADDDVTSVNLCNGPSIEIVKDWYASKGKSVYAIHEVNDGEIREATAKGMPWTEVPEEYMWQSVNGRIISVLNDLIEIADDEDNQMLIKRIYQIVDAINEERI